MVDVVRSTQAVTRCRSIGWNFDLPQEQLDTNHIYNSAKGIQMDIDLPWLGQRPKETRTRESVEHRQLHRILHHDSPQWVSFLTRSMARKRVVTNCDEMSIVHRRAVLDPSPPGSLARCVSGLTVSKDAKHA